MAYAMDQPRAAGALLWTVRMAARSAAVAALLLVSLHYDSLPQALPLTLSHTAPKSWLIALRAPAINLMAVCLVDVLSASLRRLPGFAHGAAITAILLLIAAAKSLVIATALLLLPRRLSWLTLATELGIISGLAAVGYLGRELWQGQRLRSLSWTTREGAMVVVLGSLLVALELPLLAARH
jgi:hypothetical protein